MPETYNLRANPAEMSSDMQSEGEDSEEGESFSNMTSSPSNPSP